MRSKVINKNLNTNNIITCDNLNIFVGPKNNQITLIDNFKYAFEKGKVYAIVGNSGVGKSTLASHLNGLKRSRVGNIFVKDNVINGSRKKLRNYKEIRKDVGLVFQFSESQIFKDTVEKDIMYGPINNHVNNAKAKELASKYMYLVGLDNNLLKVNPFELSNGQKRLVAIAGILSIESDVVVLDEPSSGLDPRGQKKINDIISLLKKQGKTIIIITHNTDSVLAIADEVLLIHNNKLYASEKPYSIFANEKLMEETKLAVPNIINVVNKIIAKDNSYLYLLNEQPKTIEQLVLSIKKGGQ